MWLSATFGLVGVIVGALVTGGLSLAMERRKERRTLRTAQRLIRADLVSIDLDLEQLAEHGLTPPRMPAPERFLPTDTWQEYRSVIAAGLDDEADWDTLAALFEVAQSLRAATLADPPGSPLDPKFISTIQRLRKLIPEQRRQLGEALQQPDAV